MKNVLVILAITSLQLSVHAQKKGRAAIDSLTQVLQNNPNDTTRVRAMNLLSLELKLSGKVDTALQIASSSLELAKKINFVVIAVYDNGTGKFQLKFFSRSLLLNQMVKEQDWGFR
jgi:hypothetical protein